MPRGDQQRGGGDQREGGDLDDQQHGLAGQGVAEHEDAAEDAG